MELKERAEEVGGGAACEGSHNGCGCDGSVPRLRMWADGGLRNWATQDGSVGLPSTYSILSLSPQTPNLAKLEILTRLVFSSRCVIYHAEEFQLFARKLIFDIRYSVSARSG